MAEIQQPDEVLKVFYSYSHRDEGLRNELAKHLTLLERQGLIAEWHDRKIGPGRKWEGQIDIHLKEADFLLFLVSADFIASDYCYDVELSRAMKRHEAGEACVIPIILRPVDWEGAPFAKLQALPRDAKPVTSWENQDEAFQDISQAIRRKIEELRNGSTGEQTQRRATRKQTSGGKRQRTPQAKPFVVLKSTVEGLQGENIGEGAAINVKIREFTVIRDLALTIRPEPISTLAKGEICSVQCQVLVENKVVQGREANFALDCLRPLRTRIARQKPLGGERPEIVIEFEDIEGRRYFVRETLARGEMEVLNSGELPSKPNLN